jgi:outer membrane protein OmpA-like peptidoglycan-associated protein
MIASLRCPRSLVILAAFSLMAPTSKAFADPAYKASDIIAHFAPKKTLGVSRALCIGTETECGKSVSEPAKPVDGFDLRINFGYNSTQLTSAARTNLDEFARALKDPQLGGSRFIVEGHTDGMGSDAFNLDLSMRRAGAVVNYLMAHGIVGARLEAKGYGKQKPLVPDLIASQNRRVETRPLDH